MEKEAAGREGAERMGTEPQHYDLPPSFFETFLDRTYRAYSCGRWEPGDDLETAQRRNLQAIAIELDPRRDATILDVGCGWGAFARALEDTKPCRYVGLSPSTTQTVYLRRLRPHAEVHTTTWQNFNPPERFDGLAAIESVDHIATHRARKDGTAVERYRRFFRFAADHSTPSAPLFIQTTLTRRDPRTRREREDAWFILRKVYPGSTLASLDLLEQASAGTHYPDKLSFYTEDYLLTLRAWQERLRQAQPEHGEDTRAHFDRFFTACTRLFEAGTIELMRATYRRTDQGDGPSAT